MTGTAQIIRGNALALPLAVGTPQRQATFTHRPRHRRNRRMTPERQMTHIWNTLTQLGVQPITCYAVGPNQALQVTVRLRNQEDLQKVAELGENWRLTCLEEVP